MLYQIVTTITLINQRQAQFSTISICGYPPFNTTIKKIILKISFETVKMTNLCKVFEEFIDPIYGKCFRINSGKNMLNEKMDLLNSTTEGYSGRLSFHFNLEILDGYYAEVLIQIHNSSMHMI